jgi:hypothetical protein
VDGRIPVPNAEDEWRPAAARPRPWSEIPDYHAGRRRPVALPTPAAAAASVPTDLGRVLDPQSAAHSASIVPATDPAVAAPLVTPRILERAPARRPVRRRLRRLVHGYLEQAQAWISEPEADPEA